MATKFLHRTPNSALASTRASPQPYQAGVPCRWPQPGASLLLVTPSRLDRPPQPLERGTKGQGPRKNPHAAQHPDAPTAALVSVPDTQGTTHSWGLSPGGWILTEYPPRCQGRALEGAGTQTAPCFIPAMSAWPVKRSLHLIQSQ